MSALLSSMIGAIAVLLAVIGIHGVLAYSVSRRTREIGVRVAIGANPASVARAVMRDGALLTLIGVAVGIAAAFFGARLLRALLFGISETDALSFAASAMLFALLGAVAGILPARRAARIDPAITLRADKAGLANTKNTKTTKAPFAGGASAFVAFVFFVFALSNLDRPRVAA